MWNEFWARGVKWMSQAANNGLGPRNGGPPRRSAATARRNTGARKGSPLGETLKAVRPANMSGLFYWVAVIAVWGGICLTGLVGYYALDLPDTSTVAEVSRAPGLTLRGHDNKVVARRGGLYGTTVTLDSLPQHLPEAVIATEDRRFYDHGGLDVRALLRATVANLAAGHVVQGGSTITQQLAKNLFLDPDRTLRRKVQELLLAFWLEQRFSKQEILSLYLNRVYFGAGAYGVDAASRRYFDKPASKVTVAESALLAGLLKAPTRFAPTNDLAAARQRAGLVLKNMVAAGFISEKTAKQAAAHPAELAPSAGVTSTNYVVDWLTELLPGYIGRQQGDIIVTSTLDARMQAIGERVIQRVLGAQGKKLNAGEAALVVMTPDGAIRAMIGGRDYRESQFNRVTQARRQPGSAFKPFIYLAALEAGMGPNTIRFDAPVSIGNWRPDNFTPGYSGPVTLSEALAKSINTVAVRLMEEVGRDQVVNMAERLGVQSPLQRLPSLALGTEEMTLFELTTAYAVLANGGIGVFPHLIDTVSDGKGTTLYERTGQGPGRVLSERTAGLMNSMLSQTLSAGTGRAASLPDGRAAAGKTGTTQNFRDAWFVGYTADLVVGVWVGNDDGKAMKKVTGGGLPAQIWRAFMEEAGQGLPQTSLPGWSDEPIAPYEIAGVNPEISTDAMPMPEVVTEERRGFFGRLFSRFGGRDRGNSATARGDQPQGAVEYVYPEENR